MPWRIHREGLASASAVFLLQGLAWSNIIPQWGEGDQRCQVVS
jgi:hypothetical protein